MRSKNVHYFTQREEDLANLLMQTGLRRNVARIFVYLAIVPEATSRDIERGTDLRQPEVSLAMSLLMEKGWISTREIRTENKGRPVKMYSLSSPVNEVITLMETDKKEELERHVSILHRFKASF